MSITVTLYKFTDQGVKNIKDSPKRLAAAIKIAEEKGIKLLGAYYTVGEYDLVVIAEADDEKIGLAHTIATVSLGNVRSTTLPAFSPKDYAKIIKKI